MTTEVLKLQIDGRGAKKGARDVNKSVKSVTKNTDMMGKSFLNVKNILTGFVTFQLSRSFINFFVDGAKAAIRQEKAIAQLRAGLESTNFVSGQTVQSITNLSTEMQRQTGIANELIEEVAGIGLSFTNITGEIFPEFLKISADVSTRMGTDLKQTAIQLAKALNDPIQNLGALSRAGIQFSHSQRELIKDLTESGRIMEAQRIILDELSNQYGGSAAAAADTLGGKLSILNEEWQDLKKNIVNAKNTKIGDFLQGMADGLKFINDEITSEPGDRLKKNEKKFNSRVTFGDLCHKGCILHTTRILY